MFDTEVTLPTTAEEIIVAYGTMMELPLGNDTTHCYTVNGPMNMETYEIPDRLVYRRNGEGVWYYTDRTLPQHSDEACTSRILSMAAEDIESARFSRR